MPVPLASLPPLQTRPCPLRQQTTPLQRLPAQGCMPRLLQHQLGPLMMPLELQHQLGPLMQRLSPSMLPPPRPRRLKMDAMPRPHRQRRHHHWPLEVVVAAAQQTSPRIRTRHRSLLQQRIKIPSDQIMLTAALRN